MMRFLEVKFDSTSQIQEEKVWIKEYRKVSGTIPL